MQTLRRAVAIAILAGAIPTVFAQTSVTPPEKFFGHQLGADRVLRGGTGWSRLQGAREGERPVEGHRHGAVDDGEPIPPRDRLVAGEPREARGAPAVNAKLSDPRGIGEAEIKKLAAEGRAVVVQSFGLHASEVAAAQTAPGVYLRAGLAPRRRHRTRSRERHQHHDPVFQPDGQIMVADWCRSSSARSRRPRTFRSPLSQYVGHDNNRDAFQTSMVESQYARRCCSATGFRRRTSITTRWALTARDSMCRHTPSRSVQAPIRSYGAR